MQIHCRFQPEFRLVKLPLFRKINGTDEQFRHQAAFVDPVVIRQIDSGFIVFEGKMNRDYRQRRSGIMLGGVTVTGRENETIPPLQIETLAGIDQSAFPPGDKPDITVDVPSPSSPVVAPGFPS